MMLYSRKRENESKVVKFELKVLLKLLKLSNC
jgi:hypothetical protein